jgi:hypothetical protein
VVGVFGAVTIGFFIVVSGVVNVQPSTRAYPGWVAVLQPIGEAFPEQAQLGVDAVEPGAPGDRPELKYTVLACGDRPFHGILLIGGQARLDHPAVMDQHGVISNADTTVAGTPRLQELANVIISQGTQSWDLGAAQMIPITIDQPVTCVPGGSADQSLQVGTPQVIDGLARAPIQHTAGFLGLNGPRSSLVLPLVGGLPGVPPNDLGVFVGFRGLSGGWSELPTLHKKVSVGSPTARVSVDLALPALTDSTALAWNSASPLRPSLRLTNIDTMASWQGFLVASSILFGIGGSLLASLLFESTRPKNVGENVATDPAPTVTPPADLTRPRSLMDHRLMNLKGAIYGAMAMAVAAAAVGAVLAFRSGTDVGQKNATLVVALMALLVTALKVLLDLFVVPDDQAARERIRRAEERTEKVAAEISGYFGVLGDQLRSQLEDSWAERDVGWVEDRAGYLASMAKKCYQIAEQAPDELAILIGVIWVSAQEVSDAANELRNIPNEDWDSHRAAKALNTVREYYAKVEDRLFELLDPQHTRRASSIG